MQIFANQFQKEKHIRVQILNFFFTCYFQTDYNRHLEEFTDHVQNLLMNILRNKLSRENIAVVAKYHGLLEDVRNLTNG